MDYSSGIQGFFNIGCYHLAKIPANEGCPMKESTNAPIPQISSRLRSPHIVRMPQPLFCDARFMRNA